MGQNHQKLKSIRTAVAFRNRHGVQLVGVLERPRVGSSDVCILMLSPGIKMRVGPERLYRRMSQAFVAQGYSVFRFDYHGLGDSEGVLPETALAEVYSHIEMGRYIEDTQDAMDWLEKETAIRKFVAAGLCGGAVTGLLAAQRDARIEGLIALSITPLVSRQTDDISRYMTQGQLTSLRQRYVRKLANPKAWLRALTLKSDFRTIWRSAAQPFQQRRPMSAVGPAPAIAPDDNSSPLFPPAFFAMAESARPMMLLFGGSDRLHFEFEEKFAGRYAERLSTLSGRYHIHVIPQANHVYTFDVWQREVVDRASDWLGARFPIRTGSLAAV